MGSWNMPDGVTESMIPGWNAIDGERDVYCGKNGKFTAVTYDAYECAKELLEMMQDNGFTDRAWRLALQLAKEVTGKYPISGTCEFSGTVEGIFDNSTFYWDCPICQTEHEDSLINDY